MPSNPVRYMPAIRLGKQGPAITRIARKQFIAAVAAENHRDMFSASFEMWYVGMAEASPNGSSQCRMIACKVSAKPVLRSDSVKRSR